MNEFDIKALTWDDNPLFIERSKHIADKIREHVKLNAEMEGFEYGCGTGLISFNLMPYLKSITLADSSDGMLEVLKQKIQKNKITSMNVLKTDLIVDKIPDKKFDIIYTALTLHHITDIETILARFYMMMKKPAFLCIADLDKENGNFHGPDFKGHKGFDREAMKKLFITTGFKNIKADTCYEMKRINEQNQNVIYPVFLMTGEK
ncbi:MAG TPA: class I SAM-dependent methyltransferase [Bacteroidales bacterium]|nr:class I SAM-dependent methyltransferase [Bacteroidales bacterium]HPS17790.1 class I SAM-dependent methyltransferase [Bacteroidales bacterium]